MVPRVVLRPDAEADLDDIWKHTTEAWSEAQALTYLSGLDSVLRLLAEFPEMARPRKEFTPPVRIHPYRAHLIIYMADARLPGRIQACYSVRSGAHSARKFAQFARACVMRSTSSVTAYSSIPPVRHTVRMDRAGVSLTAGGLPMAGGRRSSTPGGLRRSPRGWS